MVQIKIGLYNLIKIYTIPLLLYIIGSLALWISIESPKGHYDVDSYGYDPIALYFANTGTLTDPNNITSPPVQPVGYHFFLGLLYLLFGHSLAVVVLMQLVFMIIAIMILISIAMRLQGKKVATIVGILAAINLGLLIYPQLILAEVVLVLLLLLFMHCYISFLETSSLRALILSGLFLGISMLVKPVALLSMIPLLILTYIAHDLSVINRMRNIFLLLICFVLPIFCYMERNYICYGAFSFAPMTELNMYQCFLAKVISHVESIDQQRVIETKLKFTAYQAFDHSGWSRAQKHFYYYLSLYPHIFCYIWMQNVIKTWLGLYSTQLKSMIQPPDYLPTHSFFNQKGPLLSRLYTYIVGAADRVDIMILAWAELFYALMRLIFAAIGLSVLMQQKRIMGWFFLSMMITFSIVTGIDGCCRYRIAFEPILLLLAAIGLIYVYVYFIKKRESVYEIA